MKKRTTTSSSVLSSSLSSSNSRNSINDDLNTTTKINNNNSFVHTGIDAENHSTEKKTKKDKRSVTKTLISLVAVFVLTLVLMAMARPTFHSSSPSSSSSQALLSPKAYPVYGTRVEYSDEEGDTTTPIEVVYAFPSSSASPSSSSPPPVKGLVVLLHACTHSALKFFTPSVDLCPSCVGLAEEVDIVRRILERHYAVLAVTSLNRQNGCWSTGGGRNGDGRRVQIAIERFIVDHPAEFLTAAASNGNESSLTSESMTHRSPTKIFAVGTSSGGTMASKLFADGIVDGAFSGVMAVSQQRTKDEIVKRLSSALPTRNIKSTSSTSTATSQMLLYVAPMPKDHGTTQQSKQHYDMIVQQLQQSFSVKSLLHAEQTLRRLQKYLHYDDTSCTELSVTPQYLYDHVYGLTMDGAQTIVNQLINSHYLDFTSPHSQYILIKDPTKTPWRDVLLRVPAPASTSKLPKEFLDTVELRRRQHKQQATSKTPAKSIPPQQTFLWDVYELTPGYSSLAKALHRAWAFHEYCSDGVSKALDLFESIST